MDKKIVVALDDSIQSEYAVHYAVKMSSSVNKLHYVLFHVQPSISSFLIEEAKKDARTRGELSRLIHKNTKTAERLLETHKNEMIRRGIPENCIELVTQTKRRGVAKDILDSSQGEWYDAIVIARRGLTRLQQTFLGSVSGDMIEHAESIPVWLVDGEVRSSKILFAAEASETSLRALDHLCFMVGSNPEVKITIFHVTPSPDHPFGIDLDDEERELGEVLCKADERAFNDYVVAALKKLKEEGVSEDRVKVKVIQRRSGPGKAILKEAARKDFGTVVIGRRGAGNSYYMGSVARHLVSRISAQALWVVP
jgi:nucleotide-binding universal stress UspA family protein